MPVLLAPGHRAPAEHLLDLRRVRRDARPLRGVQACGDGADRDALLQPESPGDRPRRGVGALPGRGADQLRRLVAEPAGRGGPGGAAATTPSGPRPSGSTSCPSLGASPAAVAGMVLDGIRSRRFYILTSDNRHGAVLRRGEEIVAGGPPSAPVDFVVSLDWSLMSSVSPSSPTASTPPIAKQVPAERTHHGDTVDDPYAWLTDPKDPEVIAYLEAENAYTEASTAGLGRAAVRRSSTRSRRAPRRPTCRCRCARGTGGGTRARWRASSTRSSCRRRVARRRGHPADAAGRQAPRRRGGAARRERARGRGRVLLARRGVGQPRRAAARLLDRLLRRRAVHAAGEGPGDRLGARRRGPRYLLRLRLVARRLDPVLRHRRRGVAAVPGLAARDRDARRRRRGGLRGGRREVLARRRAPAATSASSRSRPRPS